MPKHIIPVLWILTSIVISSCETKQVDSKQQYWDKLTVRTMGLAFLEENMLPEAEEQFKKLTEIAPDESMGFANLGLVYLRMAKYKLAESELDQALKLNEDDPNVRLILAKVYELSDQKEKSISMLSVSIEKHDDHIKSIYALANLSSTSDDLESTKEREQLLRQAVTIAPANAVLRIDLIQTQLAAQQFDDVISNMEALQPMLPQLPDEAVKFYNQTIEDLRSQSHENANISLNIFRNSIKLTTAYQSGLQDLIGPGGPLFGFPILTFDESTPLPTDAQSILESIQFKDATVTSGMISAPNPGSSYSTSLTVADYDGDDQVDVFFSRTDDNGLTEHFLFKNEIGLFSNTTENIDLKKHTGSDDATFLDLNNDGFLDLVIADDNSLWLYKNSGEGTFESTNGDLFQGSNRVSKITGFDIDHDGDIDLFLSRQGPNLLFGNNGDGSFTEQAIELGVAGGTELFSTDAGFSDFDDDGDIDFMVSHENDTIFLYSNLRQGRFENIAKQNGLGLASKNPSLSVADFNNDGFADVFVAATRENHPALFKNNGDGSFNEDIRSANTFSALSTTNVTDSRFFDFDNDGYVDLLLVGSPKTTGERAIFLLHNDGTGIFEDVSEILPDNELKVQRIAVADYNEDGDLDIFLTTSDGNIHLLRNDGGNAHHYLKMKLVGLRTGSGKNNHFGIGAKVEVRAAGLYQMKTITSPTTIFGLGRNKYADVIRILWTNGVPQNIFSPQTDEQLVESQVLKGSCPFLYTWNGEAYVFVKDVMWKSALGMPTGIMGGNKQYAFAQASQGFVKIPGDMMKPKGKNYSVKITEELWETIYMDKVELVVMDYSDSINVVVNEKFTQPPFPKHHLYKTRDEMSPVTIVDDLGRNLSAYTSVKDNNYTPFLEHGAYQGITTTHDLIIDAGSVGNPENLFLFLNGWIFPTDASINVALSQQSNIELITPYLQVMNAQKQWETVNSAIGFPLGKDKTIVVNLSGIFKTDDHRVRIRTNMEIYWDYIYLSSDHKSVPVHTTTLVASKATIDYRGFSRAFRKGGRYGPHWFDYSEVTTGQQWRDLIGNYTRYGEVTELVHQADDRYIIANAGDEITLSFDGTSLPKLKVGWKREFLIYTEGWVKDGDLNTAESKTVEPLPFHSMTKYPYGNIEYYPTDSIHKQYQLKYNTRSVSTKEFRDNVKSSGSQQQP